LEGDVTVVGETYPKAFEVRSLNSLELFRI